MVILEKLPRSVTDAENPLPDNSTEPENIPAMIKVAFVDAMADVQSIQKSDNLTYCNQLADQFTHRILERYSEWYRWSPSGLWSMRCSYLSKGCHTWQKAGWSASHRLPHNRCYKHSKGPTETGPVKTKIERLATLPRRCWWRLMQNQMVVTVPSYAQKCQPPSKSAGRGRHKTHPACCWCNC